MSRMRKCLAVFLALSLLALAACSETSPTADPTQSTDKFATAPLPTAEDGNVTYRVTLQDESGNPIPGVFMQLTLEQSNTAVTNEQGVATWNLPQGGYVVSLVQLPSGYDYTGAAQEFYFKDNSSEMTITLMAAQ